MKIGGLGKPNSFIDNTFPPAYFSIRLVFDSLSPADRMTSQAGSFF